MDRSGRVDGTWPSPRPLALASAPMAASAGETRVRVAVVGGGMAGLAASWLLTRRTAGRRPAASVTLFEKAPSVGLGAHAVDVHVRRSVCTHRT